MAQFLARKIEDVEQLELILALRRARDKYLSASTVAQELFLEPMSVAYQLERLGAKNLVDVRIENDVLYRYAPIDDEIDKTIAELAEIYTSRRLLVMRAIGTKTSEPARAFADAFRLGGAKKKPKE